MCVRGWDQGRYVLTVTNLIDVRQGAELLQSASPMHCHYPQGWRCYTTSQHQTDDTTRGGALQLPLVRCAGPAKRIQTMQYDYHLQNFPPI